MKKIAALVTALILAFTAAVGIHMTAAGAVDRGGVIYYAVIQAVVSLSGINSNYLKLLSALIVAVFLTVPYWKAKYFSKKTVKGGKTHA